MANLIEDTESVITIVLVFGVIALLIWVFRDFWGLKGPFDSGKLQSLKDAQDGFPDGADPGTVPAAQYTQGVVESGRNFSNYVFGSDEGGGGEQTVLPPAPGSIGAQINEYDQPANLALQDVSGIDPSEALGGSEFGGSVNPAPIVTGIENWIQNNRVF